MKKIPGIVSVLLFTFLVTNSTQAQSLPGADSTLQLVKKVADWQLKTWENNGMRWPKWDWTNAAAYTGFMALEKTSKDKTYSSAMYKIGDSLNWNTGPHRFMADDYCIGQMYSLLYADYKEPKMIASFKLLADSIIAMPHTESLEWKNSIQQREWAWCDALFMGPTALAYLSSATGERKYLDIASQLWWKTTDYLFDKEEDLYFRDSKFFTAREANGKKVFWSRGNGWVIAGLVRVLENMPANYPDRPRFVDLYKKMAAKIASIQHADGTWHASLLDSASYPIKETSGTGFYCYALTWGINNGILPYKKYYPVVAKAWDALASCVHPDGKLGFVQAIGEKPGTADYNSTEVYGVGSFLLAGTEIYKLQRSKKRN